LIRLALDPWLGMRSPLLIFTAAVVIAAGRYGRGPGFLAMVLSLAAGSLRFIVMRNSSPDSVDVLANLGVFLVTSGAMLVFAAHLKSSQERTLRLQAELQQANTQSAVGAIASTLAHELNQPLAAARNYIAGCKRLAAKLDGAEKHDVISALGHSEAQIDRTSEIIRHARDLVANTSATREVASLGAMTDRVMTLLRATGICDSAVRKAIDGDADQVTVNPIQIEQVLLNLLRNACEVVEGGAGEIVVAAKADGEWSEVEVRDRGGGISDDRLRRLFSGNAGSTTGGLGHGLSICRIIVEAHGGAISAKNNDEGGASFFFRVPRHR
jgi:C4-dicarboxylate-specific signal transduction histidine kinase